MSNISCFEFFIIIAGNFFGPIKVWNKKFPVIPIYRRGSGRQIRWIVQYIMHSSFDDTSID